MAILGKNINRKAQLIKEQMINERYPIVEQCVGCNRVEPDPGLPESGEYRCHPISSAARLS